MTVHCPQCTTRFVLPEQLLGPAGARVRCPRCGAQFEVAREIQSVAGAAPAREPVRGAARVATVPERTKDTPPVSPRLTTVPAREALRVVEDLALAAPAIGEDWASGRLFSEHGPALLDAFDEYRRRAGPAAAAAEFHAALCQRWGIDLIAERGPAREAEDASW